MSNTITAINASTPSTSSSSPTVTSNGSQTLTQADFTQQDPLASGDSSGGGSSTDDYVNQLMSMTNLTTMQTMSGQQSQQLADSLPGATVEVDNNGSYTTGVVQSARVDSSNLGVYFTVGGTEYPSADLYSIQQTAAQTAAGATGTSTGTPPATTGTSTGTPATTPAG